VSDLIEGLCRLMNTEGLTGPVNTGNPDEIAILELAETIIGLTGSRSKVGRFPLPQDDAIQREPDIFLAQEALGWRPAVPLQTGLKATIEYFERILTVKHRRGT
jgi:UDP-glucuronate decarboxylase